MAINSTISHATITGSYATGAVSSVVGGTEFYAAHAGGLVGANWDVITNSYATGTVTSSGNVRIASIGGLVGQLMDPVQWREFDHEFVRTPEMSPSPTHSNGAEGSSAGGLVGATQNNTTISNVYALGDVTVKGANAGYQIFAGGLIGGLASSVESAYSTGKVTAAPGNLATARIGGSIGIADYGSTVAAVYWDTGTSTQVENGIGLNNGAGGNPIGLTTADARTKAGYSCIDCNNGFDFTNTWFMVERLDPAVPACRVVDDHRQHAPAPAHVHGAGANYVLANNIDFTASSANPACGARAVSRRSATWVRPSWAAASSTAP
jgi:hypothetical protein